MCYQINLCKAFDTVQWHIFLAVIECMHFPSIFIRWVEARVCTPMYSVKVNGSLNGYFARAQGLRQGWPLSPYLFSLVMNIFSCILNDFPMSFKPHWRCKELRLTRLFYAGDVVLFSGGDKESITHIMTSLERFSTLSGLVRRAEI